MMEAVFVFIGFVVGCVTAGIVSRFGGKKPERTVMRLRKDKIDITVQDIIRLAALRTTQDVSSLMIEYKIHIKNPEFYEKCQALHRHERELYFDELIIIFGKEHPEEVAALHERYPALSTQDILLLLMIDRKLDNRTMARIMFLTLEALKKRKTRLKAKIHPDALPKA